MRLRSLLIWYAGLEADALHCKTAVLLAGRCFIVGDVICHISIPENLGSSAIKKVPHISIAGNSVGVYVNIAPVYVRGSAHIEQYIAGAIVYQEVANKPEMTLYEANRK